MNHTTGPKTYRGVKVPHRIRYAWDSPDALGWRHGVDASQAPREVTHDAAVAEIKAAARRLESPALEARVLAALDWRSDCESVPKPPVRGELWSLLDWTFWGSGMGDVVREALADTMLAAISPELRAQAESLMQSWHDSGRRPLGRRRYEELEAEVRGLRTRVEAGADLTMSREVADFILRAVTGLLRDSYWMCRGYGPDDRDVQAYDPTLIRKAADIVGRDRIEDVDLRRYLAELDSDAGETT